jgi:hypothetical protein
MHYRDREGGREEMREGGREGGREGESSIHAGGVYTERRERGRALYMQVVIRTAQVCLGLVRIGSVSRANTLDIADS